MDGWTNLWKGGWKEKGGVILTDGRTNGEVSSGMDILKDRTNDGTYERMKEGREKGTSERTNKLTDGRRNERMDWRTNERTNERTNRRMRVWMSGRIFELVVKWISKSIVEQKMWNEYLLNTCYSNKYSCSLGWQGRLWIVYCGLSFLQILGEEQCIFVCGMFCCLVSPVVFPCICSWCAQLVIESLVRSRRNEKSK